MQYKIPVQIENEDPIFLGLGLKQLIIIMIGWWISFTLFDNLSQSIWKEIAAIPCIVLFGIFLLVAIFKHSEMTFIPFFLAILRSLINPSERSWWRWTDSFQPLDIWFITSWDEKTNKNISFDSKYEKIKNLEDKISKI